MGAREKNISRSISYTITNSNEDGKPTRRRGFLSCLFGVFNLYWLSFRLVREDLFRALRGFWQIPEAEYRASFGGQSSDGLQALGDMGYSGSTFFRTGDGAYLVKSVPRPFEHNFFKRDLVLPYADHVRANPGSLLIRITDFLECRQRSLGTLLGLAPSHHMVMENLLYGQDREVVGTGEEEQGSSTAPPRPKWESWDLKPMSYFYPERDVAGGALASEATKSKLADEFPDKLHLTLDQAEEFRAQLQKDTRLLADANAVDYSLFLVRVSGAGDLVGGDAGTGTGTGTADADTAPDPLVASRPPFAPPNPPSWRAGMIASHGGEVYRAAILDFFWAKHTVHAKAMTGLISTYNLIDEQGPMSVTADSNEYRDRFLKMCLDIVEVEGGRPWPVETGSDGSS